MQASEKLWKCQSATFHNVRMLCASSGHVMHAQSLIRSSRRDSLHQWDRGLSCWTDGFTLEYSGILSWDCKVPRCCGWENKAKSSSFHASPLVWGVPNVTLMLNETKAFHFGLICLKTLFQYTHCLNCAALEEAFSWQPFETSQTCSNLHLISSTWLLLPLVLWRQ